MQEQIHNLLCKVYSFSPNKQPTGCNTQLAFLGKGIIYIINCPKNFEGMSGAFLVNIFQERNFSRENVCEWENCVDWVGVCITMQDEKSDSTCSGYDLVHPG